MFLARHDPGVGVGVHVCRQLHLRITYNVVFQVSCLFLYPQFDFYASSMSFPVISTHYCTCICRMLRPGLLNVAFKVYLQRLRFTYV